MMESDMNRLRVYPLIFLLATFIGTGVDYVETNSVDQGRDSVGPTGNCTLAELLKKMEAYRVGYIYSLSRGAGRSKWHDNDVWGREPNDYYVEIPELGELLNCTYEFKREERLSNSSLTGLCFAQCMANCNDHDTDCEDRTCTKYTTEDWTIECGGDYNCLRRCAQNLNYSAEDLKELIPETPTTLNLTRVKDTVVYARWISSSGNKSIMYVTENLGTNDSKWSVFNESPFNFTRVEIGVCDIVAFRVAAVNQYGFSEFSLPFVRTDLPAPSRITPLNESLIWFPKEYYYNYSFFFSVPEEWAAHAIPRMDSEPLLCSNMHPQIDPDFREFKPHGNGIWEYRATFGKYTFLCIYKLKVYVRSPCYMYGPMHSRQINLRSCNVTGGGAHCTDSGSATQKRTTTTRRTSTMTTTLSSAADNGPATDLESSTGGASTYVYVGLSVALGLLAAGAVFAFVCFRRCCGESTHHKKLNGDVEEPAVKLKAPLHVLKTDNALYTTHENYADIFAGCDEWEISRDLLDFSGVLGQGAFGQVRKGVLRASDDLLRRRWFWDRQQDESNCTHLTVAVKMLIGDHANLYRQDFLREMELMKSIGYHSNVVSMIGCCTREDPLCLVVEHVPLGDLLHYLQSYRARCQQQAEDKTVEMDYLSYGDLLNFAKQIAVGMEFLSRKSFVHRDLAARNILVGEGKTLKIGDFGLTRYIYDDQVYVTKQGGKLPLKWMAIESIFDLTFTTASDVWSFGIVLYELVTLGGTPYPTISHRDLLRQLQKGYRMERPDNCTPELYCLMMDCWQQQLKCRPSFTLLCSQIDTMMERGPHTQSETKILPSDGMIYRISNSDSSSSNNSCCVPPISAASAPDFCSMATPSSSDSAIEMDNRTETINTGAKSFTGTEIDYISVFDS